MLGMFVICLTTLHVLLVMVNYATVAEYQTVANQKSFS
jgi:hypothetical protein